MNLGDTFIWAPDAGKEHLYIAITDPSKNSGKLVVVNLTKSAGGAKSFVLRPGDHPFIRRDSDVNFGDAMIVSTERIDRQVRLRLALPREPMDLSIVHRIAAAAKDHPAVSEEIQALIASACP